MATTNDESNSKHLIINGQTISEDGSVENNLVPKDALIYNEHSYYIYSNVVETWEAAKAYCEALGGHLAVINDVAENSALYKYKVQKGYATVYLGLTDANHEGEWTWVTGEPVTYTNWYKGYPCNEPNNGLSSPVENYAELWNGTNLTRNHAYTWNDATFPKGSAFICEWGEEFIGFTENDDTCDNTLDDKKLLALGGNDEINTKGDNITIDGGKNDDKISNYGAKTLIVGGEDEGCDTVDNSGIKLQSWRAQARIQ